MSKLRAIGKSSHRGDYRISFYYELPGGGLDVTMPTWDIPAVSWDHMQNTVRAFNNED